MTENSVSEYNNWNRRSKAYLSETKYHPYSALSQTSSKFIKSSVIEYSFEEVSILHMKFILSKNMYLILLLTYRVTNK